MSTRYIRSSRDPNAQRPRDYDPQPIPGRTSSEVLGMPEDRSPATAHRRSTDKKTQTIMYL